MAAVYSFLWVLFCIMLQVLVFNHLHLLGGIVLIYLLPLIKMPVQVPRSLQIFLGFLCGLVVDIFSNSIGMHALTCTFTMWMRLPLLHMFVVSDDIKTGTPGKHRMGIPLFARYSFVIIAMHTVVLYLIESFTLFNLIPLIIRIFITVLMTVLFSIVIETALRND